MKKRAILVLCCIAVSARAQPVIDPPITYQQQIKPLLDRACSGCHSGWFPKGGLRLDSLENIYKGGANGAVLFAGEPDKGTLINLIRVVPGRFSPMPPGPAAVDPESFELLRLWIEQGAS
ncbi:MAG: hypothetical protein ACJAWL_002389 [Motiliproteus sp.]|jgi:hypothetical protein